MIRMQFVLGSGLSSRAIAYFGAGGFSHTDAVLSNGELLGARSDRVGHRPPGVEIRVPNYEHWKKQQVVSLDVDCFKTKRFYDFLREQIGKPYDSTAIWGFALDRDWRSTGSWFCSELISAALEESGVVPKLCAPANKIVPGALMLISTAIGGEIHVFK